ncbi:ATP-dependent DNA ligase [Streptomyces sp. B6B3]|uniref:ATP-dependent DNA ligase n=1 Tax=Streptomyces sp. B6B3 TaxID=3153570 RepID=UPI00325EF02F
MVGVVVRIPREPILAAPVADLPRAGVGEGVAWEPKWDGYRAFVARSVGGGVVVRSRHGTDLTTGFPDIAAAAGALPDVDLVLDGELVIWQEGRLAFERLGERLGRRPDTARRLAAAVPAHFVVFDLLHHAGVDYLPRPYSERRAALEELFAGYDLGPPWTLCPSTTDPAIARRWLEWAAVGVEGLVAKPLSAPYRPGTRGWRKYRVRHTTEAVIGAVTGSLTRPSSVLLGRLQDGGSGGVGRLRYAGRTTTVNASLAEQLAAVLAPAGPGHPWQGVRFSVGWGSHESLRAVLVDPQLVAEISADVALDRAGRWRHPVRLQRLRPDLAPVDVPVFGAGNHPAAG